jgi:glutaconate CoA-transferase subunit B
MSGAGGAINSQAPLVTSSSDYRTHEGAEYIMTLEDIVDWELGGWRKLSMFGVVGGIQIDEAGSVNMAYLGEREHYDLRGPGSVGLVFGTSFSEMMFYLHSHSPEILCGEVDFISSPGYTDGRAADVPEHSEGPSFGITPMATMRFDGAMYVDTIHPGYTAEQVAAATGFEIEISDQVTEPPTEEELEILRNEVDPNGVLQEMDIP